jgi:hypothetical protein
MAAERVGSASVAMWNPVVDGGRYVRSLVKAALMAEMAGRGRPRSAARHPRHDLEERGLLEVEGYPLGRRVFDEVSSLNLLQALDRFDGEALILQVSATPGVRPDLDRMAGRIRSLGGAVRLETLEHPEARMFARQRYLGTEGGRKIDTQASVSRAVVERTVAWCEAVDVLPLREVTT